MKMTSLYSQKRKSKTNKWLPALLKLLSPYQTRFVLDPNRQKLARCGRRAGKTYALAALFIKTGMENPNSPMLYVGLTRESAKEAIWSTMLQMLDKLGIPYSASPANLRIDFENGSSVQLLGADTSNVRNRLRGRKYKLVAVDECPFFAEVDGLIKDVLLATLTDLQGTLVMTSSPGPLLQGFFYDADQGEQKDKWSRYHWDLLVNPHFMQPSSDPKYGTLGEEELDRIIELQFDGDREHPTYRREFRGLWVTSERALTYPFDKSNIIVDEYKIPSASYAVGLNLSSYGKAHAVVLKYGEYNREVQVVETMEIEAANLDELAEGVADLYETYEPDIGIAYLGDLDKDILEDFQRRYKIGVSASRYSKTPFYQGIIATDMANGYIKVAKCANSLVDEWTKIVKDENHEEIEGQLTAFADAFFVAYLRVYNVHLKSFVEPETEEARMERELMDSVREELADNRDYYYYGYDSDD